MAKIPDAGISSAAVIQAAMEDNQVAGKVTRATERIARDRLDSIDSTNESIAHLGGITLAEVIAEAQIACEARLHDAVLGAILGLIKAISESEKMSVPLMVGLVRNGISNVGFADQHLGALATAIARGVVVSSKCSSIPVDDAAFAVSFGLITGVNEIRGEIAATAQYATRGTMAGAAEIGANPFDVVSTATRGLIRGTYEIFGNIPEVALCASKSAIASASDLGLNAEEAFCAVKYGAIAAADEIDATTGKAIAEAVSQIDATASTVCEK